MKLLHSIVAVLAFAVCLGAAQVSTSSAGRAVQHQTADPNGSGANYVKVKPGHSGTNGDISVTNNANSNGDAKITPKSAQDADSSTVTTETGFSGDISGLESGDTATVGNNSQTNVNGAGGTVNVGSACTTTVTNAGSPNTSNMTINLPSGTNQSLAPGSSTTINT